METTISQTGDGEDKFFSVVLRDITDRNADKLATMGRMAAAIAHEINGPLDTVANLLFALEHDQLSDSARAVAQSAQEEVRRIGEIAQLTLGFMRKGARAEVRVTDLIDGILTLYGHRIESLGIFIIRRYESAGVLVADAGELRQVLSNLIVNASEALAKKGGRLLIHVHDSPDWKGVGRKGVRVVIADNGCGIPQEVRHALLHHERGKGHWARSVGFPLSGGEARRPTTSPEHARRRDCLFHFSARKRPRTRLRDPEHRIERKSR